MSWATRGMLRLLCGVALSCALVACHGPQATGGSVSSPAAAFTIRGRVSFGPDGAASGLAGRQVQSSITEIAEGSTVSLIDATTGQTVATTVTQPDGAFSLTIAGWTPAGGTPYLMEAVKGLEAGENSNRAGAAIARVRTIIAFEGGGWLSINNSSGGVDIDPGTTALAIAATDEGLSASSELAMMNTYSFGTYSGSVLSASAFTTVTALVNTALAADQDPVDNVVRDPATGTWALRPGNVVIDPEVSPSVISAGGTATFYGQDLPGPESSPSVAIGGLPVASWTINASRSALTVTLPSNGYSGLLTITDGGSTWTGPFLGVHNSVGVLAGHDPVNCGGNDGIGYQAQFCGPGGIILGNDGDLYEAMAWGNFIRKIDPRIGQVTTIATNVGNCLDSLAMASDGSLYATGFCSDQVYHITTGGSVSVFAGNGTAGHVDGATDSAEFNAPRQITIDANGNLYIAEQGNNDVRMITQSGVVSTLAGNGTAGYADGAASSAEFDAPQGIAVDASGDVYVADSGGNRIREIAGGTVSTLAGNGSGTEADGTGTAASFDGPGRLGWDGSGNLLVPDQWAGTIRKVTPTGVVTTLFAAAGNSGFASGQQGAAQTHTPIAVAWTPSGTIFFTEWVNEQLRGFTP